MYALCAAVSKGGEGMRIEQTKCDCCGKIREEQYSEVRAYMPALWYHLSLDRDVGGDWDFCSRQCLALWAATDGNIGMRREVGHE